jgi:hypothetical protein
VAARKGIPQRHVDRGKRDAYEALGAEQAKTLGEFLGTSDSPFTSVSKFWMSSAVGFSAAGV